MGKERAGFEHTDIGTLQVQSCFANQRKIMPGAEFVPPPPVFLASSTGDDVCPPSENHDVFSSACETAGVPVTAVRVDFEGHGFGLQCFWTAACHAWLTNL